MLGEYHDRLYQIRHSNLNKASSGTWSELLKVCR